MEDSNNTTILPLTFSLDIAGDTATRTRLPLATGVGPPPPVLRVIQLSAPIGLLVLEAVVSDRGI